MNYTKSQIDRAGRFLLDDPTDINIDEYISADSIVDDYRQIHLQPLTEINLKLQEYLFDFKTEYYIAQRLKRKPQIIRKLKRFSVRLTQLQDIAGCRIIFNSNIDIDRFIASLTISSKRGRYFIIDRIVDYREKGRDDSGYRAVHIILKRNNIRIELQLRSRIQHYWAESIERTSIIYGFSLKEGEGNSIVIDYFKKTSDAFYYLENNQNPNQSLINDLDDLRDKSETIISKSDKYNILDSYVNDGVIKSMISRESLSKTNFNNWLIVFDWKNGSFISWEMITKDPIQSISRYSDNEKRYPYTDGFEVVMIGSSNVATIRKTHSHYFGIQPYERILESLDDSRYIFNRKKSLDADSIKILRVLVKKRYWAAKTVSMNTLKNHFCKELLDFDSSFETLLNKEFIISSPLHKDVVSLNIDKKNEIDKILIE